MNLTKNSTTEQIKAAFAAQGLTISETPRIFAMDRSKVDGKVTLYVIGAVQSSNSSSGSFSSFQSLAYQSQTLERTLIVFDQAFLQQQGLNIGSELVINGISGRIQILESVSPQYEGQSARRRKTGEPIMSETGQPVYRSTRIVTPEELADQGHEYIPRAYKGSVATTPAAQQTQQQQFQQPVGQQGGFEQNQQQFQQGASVNQVTGQQF